VIGQTISHYKITEKLGEGGMGVVYKAEDTKLDRPVALKFLAAHLLNDEEAKARFLREAKAAAGLHHPNICPVHEIGEAEGKTFLSMAFIEGEPLEAKIERGPLPLKEVLEIGRQIAEGLEAAHEKGVVHRDIKPANVMVDAKGRATIMDFGLARLTEASRLTKTDQTMGTVAYMSPEQAQGMEVDNRSDIWALGVVLYEMVRGQRPFQGEYDQALFFEIVNQEPEPLTGVRAGVPMELEFIVGKCLAKDRDDRPSSSEEIARDLRTLGQKLRSGRSTVLRTGIVAGAPAGSTQSPGQTESPPLAHPLVKYRVIEDGQETGGAIRYVAEDTELRRSVAIRVLPQASEQQIEHAQRRKQSLLLGTTALAVLLALVFASFWLSSTDTVAEAPLLRFAFTPESLDATTGPRAAISPDGRHIVFVAGREENKLWVRDFDREEPRELDGTEGAESPFWSPDSQFIGFAANRELKKISPQGGPPITLCPLPDATLKGGGWSPDGDLIAFASGAPAQIYEVPARGGEPRLLFEPEAVGITSPHFLPLEAAARSMIFDFGDPVDREIAVRNLETGEQEVLGKGAYPVYSPSGHIVFQTNRYESGLWALPFSIDTLKPTGEAFPIAENAGGPSVAMNDALVSVDLFDSGQQQLRWRDRKGMKLDVIGRSQQSIRYPALSKDGRRVAVSATESGNTDIWAYEVDRDIKRRLTFDLALDVRPVWSPSGKEIAFQSMRQGSNDIFRRPADGTGEPVLLAGSDEGERPYDWSADGKYLLYTVSTPENAGDLWYLQRKEDGSGFEPSSFLQTSFNENTPSLSPNGRFVTYCSNESGQYEVYVQPFPGGGGSLQVSIDGGWQPRWSREGKELLYVRGDTLMAVNVTTIPDLSFDSPTPLFSDRSLVTSNSNQVKYDVSADGKKFVLVGMVESEEDRTPSIHVVQNWYEAFRDRE
jgi:Tol biopolymer transport system component/predicted Ser/Thr protein kinase